jgi:hypothetical protein
MVRQGTNDSEDLAASIFMLKMEAAWSSETLMSCHITTCHENSFVFIWELYPCPTGGNIKMDFWWSYYLPNCYTNCESSSFINIYLCTFTPDMTALFSALVMLSVCQPTSQCVLSNACRRLSSKLIRNIYILIVICIWRGGWVIITGRIREVCVPVLFLKADYPDSISSSPPSLLSDGYRG